jgi:diguanylate cyclase (GGDEF)-like protein
MPANRERRAKALAASGSPARAFELALACRDLPDGSALQAERADCLADCCLKMARYERGIEYCRQAAAIWEKHFDTLRLAQSISLMAELLADVGAPDAGALARRAMHLAEEGGDPAALARANMSMGLVLLLTREPEEALPFAQRAADISRQAGLKFSVALVNLAEAVVWCGLQAAANGSTQSLAPAVARAVALSREALAEARETGDGWLARLALHNIAEYSMDIGDVAVATVALAEVPDTTGEPTTRCEVHHLLIQARVLNAQGMLEPAEACLSACLDLLKDADYLEMEVSCFSELANVLERMERFEEALAAHRQFHARHIRMASAQTKRLALLAAHETEARALRDAAGKAQSLAANLERNIAELTQETERLHHSNLTDALTGLPNRRRLEMALCDLAATAAPFACAMMDVDHFKEVNDRFSHAVGDAVLRKIGEIFTRMTRGHDLIARFGGEEFVLLIYGAGADMIHAIGERMRRAVDETNWAAIQPDLFIKISVGIALSQETTHPDLALKLADRRLYEAKRGGRNRVVGPN